MGINPNDLPERLYRRLPKKEQILYATSQTSMLGQTEKDHQANFKKECDSRNWVAIWHNTNKKSTATTGTPDFIVQAPPGVTCWIELKLPNSILSPPQVALAKLLRANGANYTVAHSAQDATNFVLSCIKKNAK